MSLISAKVGDNLLETNIRHTFLFSFFSHLNEIMNLIVAEESLKVGMGLMSWLAVSELNA